MFIQIVFKKNWVRQGRYFINKLSHADIKKDETIKFVQYPLTQAFVRQTKKNHQPLDMIKKTYFNNYFKYISAILNDKKQFDND